MMKILMVNTEFSRGGAAQVAKILHEALNATPGFQSLFVYGRGPKVYENALRFAWQPEVYLHAFLTRALGLQGYGSWFSTRRLKQVILQWNPNIIHLHNLHGYYINLDIIKALADINIPIVWTLHDGWPLTGRCSYWLECSRWKTGCGYCPDLSRYPKTYLDTSAFMWKKKHKYFAQRWDPVIVCPSQWLANQVKTSYLGNYRVEVIPHGINTEVFRPRNKAIARNQLGIPDAKKVILFVAADLGDERKGAKYLFEALQYINTADWMVITVGKKADVKKGIAVNSIKHLGYVSAETLPEVYSAADILCVPSLDEVFGLVVTESMACGTPIVGFKVGGIAEQVTEDCGILVAPRDVKALKQAIESLLQNNELREEMGRNCRVRAETYYSVKRFVDRHLKLYCELFERQVRNGRT
jgi:putative colanic acid biosynthesis glycosyltransferase